MSGYVVVNLNVLDSEKMAEYSAVAGPSIKKFGGEAVVAGNIIIRQRGTKYHPGLNVGMGKDHTIFSLIDGHVKFKEHKGKKMFVSVEPIKQAAE